MRHVQVARMSVTGRGVYIYCTFFIVRFVEGDFFRWHLNRTYAIFFPFLLRPASLVVAGDQYHRAREIIFLVAHFKMECTSLK